MRASVLASAALFGLAMCGAGTPAPALPLVALTKADLPEPSPAKASTGTADYIRKTAYGDSYQITAANLAALNAQSPDVRNYAHVVLREHSDSRNGLRAAVWLSNARMTIPSELDDTHQAMINELKGMSARDFDRLYMEQQLTTQEEAQKIQAAYASTGDVRPLRSFAAELAPKVEGELTMARHIDARIGGMTARR